MHFKSWCLPKARQERHVHVPHVIAVLIIPQFLRPAGSEPMHLRHVTRKRRAVRLHILQMDFQARGPGGWLFDHSHDKFHAIPLFQPEPIANLQRYRDLALAANGARACNLYFSSLQ